MTSSNLAVLVSPGVVIATIYRRWCATDGPFAELLCMMFDLKVVEPLADSRFANFFVWLNMVWLGFPGNLLLWSGSFARIPDSVIEAAKLDGANWWQQTVYITLPCLKNIGMYLLISLVVSSFQLYEIALVIVGSGAMHATEGPIYYLYYQFNYSKNMGEVYAASLVVAVVLTALSSVIFRLTSSEKSLD